MARSTGRNRLYEVDKAGRISIYPAMGVPQKRGVLSKVIALLKGKGNSLSAVCDSKRIS